MSLKQESVNAESRKMAFKQETAHGMETSNLTFHPDAKGIEDQVVNLYPQVTFQEIEGFGGAITDAAAYVYSLMSEEQKRQLIQTYFSPSNMKYCLVRIHMDSCDFSTGMYEAMSDEADRELKSFSFARTEKYILPMLEAAQKAAGKPLKLMLSPWSPPAFMKTNGQRVAGGSLKEGMEGFWADYICRYILEFQKRGFAVQRISLQNEPKAVQTWDSCVYTAKQEKRFLRDFMYPALQSHGLSEVEIFIWDHNKERLFERASHLIDDTTKGMVAGAAFHWYSGDHFEALELTRQKYPDLKLIISESCIEYKKYAAGEEWENAERLSHEIIGDLNHGMCAFYDWNLLLDEEGGPNHVGNFCHAPFLYDRRQKSLLPQKIQRCFAHFSSHILPGAKGIGFSKYTDLLDVTAFQNPDGSIVAIILNRSSKEVPVTLRLEGALAQITALPRSISTGVIQQA